MAVLEPTPGTWYTVQEAADLCHRAKATVRSLIFRHKVPRKLLRWSPRRPVIYLPAESVRFLQSITLEWQNPKGSRPPGRPPRAAASRPTDGPRDETPRCPGHTGA